MELRQLEYFVVVAEEAMLREFIDRCRMAFAASDGSAAKAH